MMFSLPSAYRHSLLLLFICAVASASATVLFPSPSPDSLKSGLRFLYQNDLDWNRAVNPATRQPGYILLTSSFSSTAAEEACNQLNEQLVRAPTGRVEPGLQSQLSYLVYDGSYAPGQGFWIGSNKVIVLKENSKAIIRPEKNAFAGYPALCTQSAPWNHANQTDLSPQWHVSTVSNGVQFSGYRDALSFRFTAVPYANLVDRFAYSTVYDPEVDERSYSVSCVNQGRADQCPQNGGTTSPWNEQCLVANVYTPYLPTPEQVKARKGLRPVLLWVHGGGSTTGSGLDLTFDGGNLASRSDIVLVSTNYRLGALGGLAYNDEIRGNYGLGDVLTVLRWIQKYGPSLGADPNRVTIAGQSSGANYVVHLLTSPAAEGLFHRAMIFSGKGQDNSTLYPTIDEARTARTGQIVKDLGCDTAPDILACLRQVDTGRFLSMPYTKIVQDGTIITSPRLDLRPPGVAKGHVNRVPIVTGGMRDELAALGKVPPKEQDLPTALATAGVADDKKQIVLNNTVAFPVETFGAQNLTVAVQTDLSYRCPFQAFTYAMVENGVFPSVHSYVYNQRAFQIPNYDPNAACQPKNGDLSPNSYYFCHSGDLMTLFHTNGIQFRENYRDALDLGWMTLIMDQFSAFIRTGDPAPEPGYLVARGKEYQITLDRATARGMRWNPLVQGRAKQSLSFGPVSQMMVPLAQLEEQCAAFGLGQDYILKQLAASP